MPFQRCSNFREEKRALTILISYVFLPIYVYIYNYSIKVISAMLRIKFISWSICRHRNLGIWKRERWWFWKQRKSKVFLWCQATAYLGIMVLLSQLSAQPPQPHLPLSQISAPPWATSSFTSARRKDVGPTKTHPAPTRSLLRYPSQELKGLSELQGPHSGFLITEFRAAFTTRYITENYWGICIFHAYVCFFFLLWKYNQNGQKKEALLYQKTVKYH